MSAECVLDNQMCCRCVKMCPHVMVSAPEVVILAHIMSDTEACQTCREPAAARRHCVSPRHQNMSQTPDHVLRHALSAEITQILHNITCIQCSQFAITCRQECSDVARHASPPPDPTWGERSDVAEVGRVRTTSRMIPLSQSAHSA